MRVLSLCFEDVTHPTGGMGVHCRDLYRALGARGHEITIICIASEPPPTGEFRISENVRVLKISRTHSFRSDVPLLWHFLMEHDFTVNVLDNYGREKFDLIHIHDSHLWAVAEALQALWRIPIVLTSHLCPLLHEMRYSIDLLAQYKNQLEGSALIGADEVITVSWYYQRQLRESLLKIETTVIHNGVDADDLQKYARSDEVRAQYGSPEHLAVMVARPVASKGIDLFVEAARRMPDWKFVFVGYLPDSVERYYPLAEQLQEVEKIGNFKWERHISHEDKYRLMASADVGCVPSLYEPFGIAALEWMALRVPLVTTAVGGLAEFCAPENSMIIEPDAGQLVTALRGAPSSSLQLENAYRTAQRFSWEKVADRTAEIYRKVVGSG